MSYPKIESCPRCGSEDVTVYSYDSGWHHAECDGCGYLGPGEGSATAAIKAHNKNRQPCPCCGPGKFTGLPGNACENCMNVGTVPLTSALPDSETDRRAATTRNETPSGGQGSPAA